MKHSYISPQVRRMHRWAGLLVVATLICGGIALFTAGRAQNWFSPGVTVRILMPESGLFGLSAGARVEIFGTDAGSIRSVVIRAHEQSYAEADIRRDFLPFLRDDSRAVIRRQFGVAGAAYLEITQGSGAPLDPEYLVIEASADRAPTETLETIIDELRSEALPILAEIKRATTVYADLGEQLQNPQGSLQQLLANLNSLTQRIDDGQGTLGRLLTDDSLYTDVQTITRNLGQRIEQTDPILTDAQTISANIARLTTSLEQEADTLPLLLNNLADASSELPALSWQLQATLQQMEALLQQLRGHWLLGGSSDAAPQDLGQTHRLPPWNVPELQPTTAP